jgi:2-polyprenyl-6-methoxyphenol hydroxylase-like FAD-dependent oxidoreductase
MGTSLALSGAYNLAGALASHPDDISAALDQYEKVQRPLVEAGQKLSPAVGLLYGSDTELRVWLVNWFVACVAFFGPVLKLFFLLAGGQGNAKGEGLREYGFKR